MKKFTKILTIAAIGATAIAGYATQFKAGKYSGAKRVKADAEQVQRAVVVPDHTAYGWVTRDRGTTSLGIASFQLGRPDLLTSLYPLSNKAFAGAYADGKYIFYRYKDDSANQELIPIALSTVDLATGKVTDIADWSDQSFILNDMTYDYSTGTLYALGRSVYIDDFLTALSFEYSALYTINTTTGVATEVKQFIDWSTGTYGNRTFLTLAADLDGNLYSIDANGYLIKFDKENDYEEIQVGDTGLRPHTYLQCMEFDHNSETLYWAADYKTKLADFSVVDTQTGKATVIGGLGVDSRLAGLYIPFDVPASGAPDAITNVSAVSDQSGANSITLSWTNPSQTYGKVKLTSISKVVVSRGDEVVAELTGATPGATMSYVDKVDKAGAYTYSIAAYNLLGKGLAHAVTKWVGHDVPAAVSDLSISRNDNGSATINWTEPTEGAHGGWIDKSSLRYQIMRLPDGVQVASAATGNSFTDGTISTIGKYYYNILPYTADGEGEALNTDEISIGNAITEYPWNCLFEDKGVFNTWTVVDNNGGSTWSWKQRGLSDYDAFAMYGYNTSVPGDDYLISPDLYLKKGGTYTVKFNYRGANANYVEKFEVTFGQGKTAEAQSQVLKSYTVNTGDGATDKITLPAITADGVYNIAFHAISDVAQYNLYITDVTVDQTSAPSDDSSDVTLADISNLTASCDKNTGTVTLKWNTTDSGSSSDLSDGYTFNIEEGFETMNDREINPAGDYDWTYIDGDGGIPYNDDYDGTSPTGGLPLAAIAINPQNYSDYMYVYNPAHGGDQLLAFLSNYKGGNPDDYFISPRLNYGQEFVFSFWCKADPDVDDEDEFFGGQWNTEKFQVGYSTTGNAAEDFIWMSDQPQSVTTTGDEWVKKEYSMPADAKYVCIHYMTPENGFMFFIDDVFIGIPSTSSAEVHKASANFKYYEVYVDNEKVGSTTENQYVIEGLSNGLHSAKVISVYNEGSSRGVATTFTVDGPSGVQDAISQAISFYPNPAVDKISFNQVVKGANVYDMSGRLVATAAEASSLDVSALSAGTYLIRITAADGHAIQSRLMKK